MGGSGDVAWLDGLPPDEAERELSACCAARRWVGRMAAARPYGAWAALLDEADAALRGLDWAEVLEALSAHPMIGRRVGPGGGGGDARDAAWSRAEQAGMDGAAEDVASRMAALNAAYQEKFGHVFLICATGLSAEVMVKTLERRLRNDEAAEQRETRTELAAITRLRLERLLARPAHGAEVTP
jgi:2-oxo-4-hydroxy-4-carboxy-5-ureidoimidazoline decarboxylase